MIYTATWLGRNNDFLGCVIISPVRLHFFLAFAYICVAILDETKATSFIVLV